MHYSACFATRELRVRRAKQTGKVHFETKCQGRRQIGWDGLTVYIRIASLC